MTTDNTTAPVNESISLQDLNLLAQVIDIATTRGAFRANELTTIGAVYDRLNRFLSSVANSNAAATSDAAPTNTDRPMEAV